MPVQCTSAQKFKYVQKWYVIRLLKFELLTKYYSGTMASITSKEVGVIQRFLVRGDQGNFDDDDRDLYGNICMRYYVRRMFVCGTLVGALLEKYRAYTEKQWDEVALYITGRQTTIPADVMRAALDSLSTTVQRKLLHEYRRDTDESVERVFVPIVGLAKKMQPDEDSDEITYGYDI